MKKEFDFKHIGKRMPYTAPEGLMDDIENNVLESLKAEMTPAGPKKTMRLWYSATAGLVAAIVALVLAFNINHRPDDFEMFEQAFTRLSSVDQDYLLAVYQDDLFINE